MPYGYETAVYADSVSWYLFACFALLKFSFLNVSNDR